MPDTASSHAVCTAPLAVEVSIWPLDATPAALGGMIPILSAAEQARAQRFVKQEDRARWIAARWGLRQLLGEVTDRRPSSLVFGAESYGRPTLIDGPKSLSFNLSHAGGRAALAVCFGARVGIDIEELRPLAPEEMSWPMSARENATLDRFSGREKLDAFFRFWTLKEAFIKAVGTGVSLPLDSFDISAPDDGEPRLLRLASAPASVEQWTFNAFAPCERYRCAVATLSHGRRVEVSRHVRFVSQANEEAAN